jgi:hypothetical protein
MLLWFIGIETPTAARILRTLRNNRFEWRLQKKAKFFPAWPPLPCRKSQFRGVDEPVVVQARNDVPNKIHVFGERIMSKKNRKTRALKVESLENRELMAANVTAGLAGSTLVIEGTEGADNVAVVAMNSGITTVRSNGRLIYQTNSGSFNAISAKMLNGNDTLQVLAMPHRGLSSVQVDMGRGNLERVNLDLGFSRSVNVNTTNSVGAKVYLTGSMDQVFADFGSDAGPDYLGLSGASINSLTAKFGRGDDILDMKSSTIQNSNVSMGAGNDRVFADSYSDIFGGTIDGGDGADQISKRGARFTRVSLRSF